MITRLIPKSTFRAIAIQYDGSNYTEILDFCKYTHKSNFGLFICYPDYKIEINETDWILKINDDDFIVISDNIKKSIFK